MWRRWVGSTNKQFNRRTSSRRLSPSSSERHVLVYLVGVIGECRRVLSRQVGEREAVSPRRRSLQHHAEPTTVVTDRQKWHSCSEATALFVRQRQELRWTCEGDLAKQTIDVQPPRQKKIQYDHIAKISALIDRPLLRTGTL